MAHNEREHLADTVHGLLATMPEDGELIVVDDESSDGAPAALRERYPTVRLVRPPGRVGPSVARNLGARQARSNLLVFSDAHVTVPLDWVAPLARVAGSPGVGAVAPAIAAAGDDAVRGYGRTWRNDGLKSEWLSFQQEDPHPAPLLCACFMAVPRGAFEACGGFDEGLPRWGAEDDELCLRLWTLGYECRVVPEVVVMHVFRASFPYTVESDGVVHNRLRMALVHLTGPRLARALESLRDRPEFARALARVLDGDVCERRLTLHRRRPLNDEWFWARFGIESLEKERP